MSHPATDQSLPLPGHLNGRAWVSLAGYARAHARQLVRFALIGVSIAALNLLLLYWFRIGLHLSDPVAVTAMYLLGALLHFTAHRWITYGAQDRPVVPQGMRYAVMLVWNFLLMQTLVSAAARVAISPYIAVVVSTGCGMVFNFLFMTHVVFKRDRVATLTGLPGPIAAALQQRGIVAGPVLLLADSLAGLPHCTAPAGLRLIRASLTQSAALPPIAELAAVVLILEVRQAVDLERILGLITSQLAPGTLLLLSQPAASPWDRQSAHLLLLRAGYEQMWAHSHRRTLCISAKRARARTHRICSIVVPVFNEKDTFPELMRRLLAKRLDHLGLEREIILVESNSTDGTRELVAALDGTPGVRILWQDRPRGKGNAVRAGFAAASGDIVMIQDADLEYDLDDYAALLEPLLQERAAFVLGSRHSGRVRMRRFTDQRLLGEICNAAHLVLTAVINILYLQRLKDPFTMFKVFRRDCLYGLEFECNRFDFDHELLIKLLLKGYRPLEIPVNYCSRSFKQGKKIRPFRDPPGWIKADIKYRLQRLRPRFE